MRKKNLASCSAYNQITFLRVFLIWKHDQENALLLSLGLSTAIKVVVQSRVACSSLYISIALVSLLWVSMLSETKLDDFQWYSSWNALLLQCEWHHCRVSKVLFPPLPFPLFDKSPIVWWFAFHTSRPSVGLKPATAGGVRPRLVWEGTFSCSMTASSCIINSCQLCNCMHRVMLGTLWSHYIRKNRRFTRAFTTNLHVAT